ncbi:MAG: acyl-ACP--UDP-N-acetylglucosamine O-acyltransferase [Candidatus Cloacimonetes bacterium]|nr:acyl-ACP--UDP-N-acetylglucosamine O-acyltransferase [Candidatus Cloacimonadota bacterium]MCF7815019.1 acyl-ACP--UDP-N-acetylglucosamine O-acyltransferase [Candidatus Cloacimonadota bacterium]MCF7869279.1 acyl-ACP--UDP-N-acetylglucosamine O-acyltransferase [Candidatus Cloacimonadota bacterium]MCF7884695.1 acyl-ACP--UDP-N-acetylglucosamine O-acyltransferase [Candidatus Cloacimonadota bacterium]
MKIIHPTAVIDPKAVIGDNCNIGPYCIIDEDVVMGDNNTLQSNVLITGNTKIGSGNKFFHGAAVGADCQDLKYKGEPTELVIGDNNVFREFCTLNRSATLNEPTKIGSNCLLMAYSHVAHNCLLGNNIIMANAVNLAGHVTIQDFVIIGGMTAVSQFITIGKYAFVGGKSGVSKDVPPFTRGGGHPYKIVGLNSIGLQRKGFSSKIISSIKEIYKIFYTSGLNVTQAKEKMKEYPNLNKDQQMFFDFIKNSKRGITR